MKATRERFETARARTPHGVGNDPLLEIGRARFLVVTARVTRCRSLRGRARIAGGATTSATKLARCTRETFRISPGQAGKEKKKTLLR